MIETSKKTIIHNIHKMEITIFLKGIFIGFVLAIPLGPIGVMCIRKTLIEGRLRGLVIGLGAATADLIYGAVAAFGLTIISDTIDDQKIWIRLFGGVLLLFLGIKAFRARSSKTNLPGPTGILKSYFATVLLTLTNPITIFAFIAVFAALGLGNNIGYFSASALVAGIFIGSILWFFTLNSGVFLFRKKLDLTGLLWVNRIAGSFIIISGVVAMVSVI